MQRLICFLFVILLFGVIPSFAWATDTWCSSHFPGAVFCDDFDRYCENPPPAPEACPIGATRAGTVYDVWSPIDRCGATITLEDNWVSSDPFSGRAPSPPAGDLGSSIAPISSFIRDKFGQAYGQVAGTDLTPLTLECALDGPIGKMSGLNAYMELAAGAAQYLTDFVRSPTCTSACGGDGSTYPIICAQNTPPANCPASNTGPIKTSVAVGALAYLDSNPCHCGEAGDHFSYNNHLVFFDGRQWWTLKQSLFPGTFQGSGDFVLHPRTNTAQRDRNNIRLTIKTNSIKVELTYAPLNEYSWCEVPRAYLGAFNLLNMGFRVPCRLVDGTWNCMHPNRDFAGDCIGGAPGGGTSTFDNIAIYGGQGYATPGACCFANTTCSEVYQGDCQVLGGQFAGSDTTCAATACCPPLPVDHDMDGDVDMQDFGWFQKCLSGQDVQVATVACKCADSDHDGDVDAVDMNKFVVCLRGSDIPAIPNCFN